jgi:predicted outer membrane repeat protein
MTVCRSGCTHRSIQAAIDDAVDSELGIIEIRDPIHTEANVTINQNVIIRGLGTGSTILQGGASLEASNGRVFHISRGVEATLQDMSIQYGKPIVEDENGGGIRNYGDLVLQNVTIRENSANGGGGISSSGTLTIIQSTIANNAAHGIAPIGLECGNGGGIQCGNGNMLIVGSTVSGNQGGVKGRARGGGINIGCACKALIVNSTISGNTASRQGGRTYSGGDSLGGGIFIAGDLQLVHSTIAGNRSTDRGAGIMNRGRLDYMNTIIADNEGAGGNCVTGVVEEGGDEVRIGTNLLNLVEGGGCNAELSDDPKLGPLQDNGGPTFTHAIAADSPAVDAVPEAACLTGVDQRGENRPSATDPSACDIGAFELQP